MRLWMPLTLLLAGAAPGPAAAQVSPMLDPAAMAEAADRVGAERSVTGPAATVAPSTPQGVTRPGGKVLHLSPGGAVTGVSGDEPPPAAGGKLLRLGGAAPDPAAPPASNDVTAAVAALRFTPSPAIHDDIRASAVASLDSSGASEDADDLRAALTSSQTDAAIAQHLRSMGMSTDNVADATALYLATAWAAANGVEDEPTAAQMQGLRDQLALTYAADPALAGADDATKQRFAEASIVSAILMGRIGADAAEVTEKPQLAVEARKGVADQVREIFGLDLTALRLTDEGLR